MNLCLDTTRHFLTRLAALCLLGPVFSACTSGDAVSQATTVLAVETGHEGHNHAPGEHGSAPAVETGHEGHNHAPGEHGQAKAAPAELDWCDEHAVPESACTRCNADLIPTFKTAGDWCAEHDLPESHCRACNPSLTFPQEEVLRTRHRELADDDIMVSLFFRPNASVCATDNALIQLASAQTAERCGVTVETVRAAAFESTITAPAEIVFDETYTSIVSSTVPALVTRWLTAPGETVRQGDVLAIVRSPEIAELKADLLSTHAAYELQRKEYDRHRQLRERDLISQADFESQQALTAQAEASLNSSRGLLLAAGLTQTDLDDVLTHAALSNQFALRASVDGMLVERRAQIGDLLTAGEAFALVAEPSAMWVEARLTEEQLRRVTVGQSLLFQTDGSGLDRVGAEIIWVSRRLDPNTRTGTVRARIVTPNHSLHAGEFGRAAIIASSSTPVALVPKDAVQWEGCCNVVFVREAPDRYRPRKVELLDGEGPYYQVTSGVQAGDDVVVNGAFLLKTELKKTSLGAGCCGLEPIG